MKYKKLNNSDRIKKKCKTTEYVKHLSFNDARHIFKKKTCTTLYVKMNYMNEMKYMTAIGMLCGVHCPRGINLRKDWNMQDNFDMPVTCMKS